MTALHHSRFLATELRGDAAIVTLERPPVNAVSQEMYVEIRNLFAEWDQIYPEVSVVILRGAGSHFCAGNDLQEFLTLTPQNSTGRMKTVREAFSAIYDCPVPVIAAVHGHALGTGVAIAGSCDLVVCANSAHFGVPEVSVGVMGGAKHLSRLVPQGILRLMYLTADPVSAADLMPYGGIASLVADEQLLDAALDLAARISRHSKVAVRAAKESLNRIEYMDLKAGYEAEQSLTGRLAGTADSLEARQAIVERREPRFQQTTF
jgi:enoyl-CoA hydratase